MDAGIPETLSPSPDLASPTGKSRNGRTPFARSALATGDHWEAALDEALDEIGEIVPDVVMLYASAAYAEFFPALADAVWQRTGAMLMVGCSTSGAIGNGVEAEDLPALALLALSLPGATLRPVRFTQAMIDSAHDADTFQERTGVSRDAVNGWVILADPFRFDALALIDRMNAAYPAVPIVGGLAAPALHQRRTWVFLNGQTYGDGAIGLAIGGDYALSPVVSQGCEPIGETWTITGVREQWIESISNRPALTVLAETLEILPDDMQEEAESNLVAGLAANEYLDHFGRGDFLIRNITAIDWEKGALSVATTPRIGQTIQFHLRDAATASLDLTTMLTESRLTLGTGIPVAGVLHACNGRGTRMFGIPDHDAGELARRYAGMPHAGMIASGEFGPIGRKNFVHGFTVSIGVIVHTATRNEAFFTEIHPGTTPG